MPKKLAKPSPPIPDTPMCQHYNAIAADYCVIQRFLEWLQLEQHAQHCRSTPCCVNELYTSRLLDAYFEVDQKMLEDERLALRDWQRQLNDC